MRPHLGLEMSVSSLLGGPVIRPSPTSHATPFLQSVLVESESIHSRTLGLWRMCIWCCRVCSFWFGFDVSVAAIRRSPNTSLPRWRSRWSERCDTRSERHSQRSERRNASSAEAAGGASAANVASSMVPNYRGGQIVAGLSQAARDGARQRGACCVGGAGRDLRHVGLVWCKPGTTNHPYARPTTATNTESSSFDPGLSLQVGRSR